MASNKKKMEVLYFVEQYIKRYGYPPTVRDIGKGLGVSFPINCAWLSSAIEGRTSD